VSRNSATWALDETAISVASRIFPRRAITIAPPCSAALPTTATTTTEMKNCESPAAFAKPSSEWTRISLVTAVAVVARAERDQRTPKRPRVCTFFVPGFGMRLPEAPKLDRLHDDVDDEQDHRDRGRQDGERMSVLDCRASPRSRERGRAAQPPRRGRAAGSSEFRLIGLPDGPIAIASPSTSSRFETTLPASEPRTTFGSPSATAKTAMISSGAFPKLAFRKPPIPGPVCSAGLLGRFADQPGERDEGRRGEHEQHDISRMEGEVDDERDRGERERRPKELPRHADTLTACPRRSSSTGVTP
jgi:hypothetical protein